jgi:abortive infection bacteriophage resistance protein
MKYCKPPLTISQQIDLLRSRGMIISDESFAEDKLASLSYYRLSAYWLPYEERLPGSTRTHRFKTGTTFGDCFSLYQFDVNLRKICFSGIKILELAIRAQFAHQLSLIYGSHFYLNSVFFNHQVSTPSGRILWNHNEALKEVEKSVLTI